MKKMLFCIAAVALMSAAFAQEKTVESSSTTTEISTSVPAAESEKNPLIPEVNINLQYASAYMSDGKILNPESMLFGDLLLKWEINKNFGFYGDIWVANDWNDCNEGTKGDDVGGVQYEPEEIDYTVGAWYTFYDVPVVNSITVDASYVYWDMPKRTGWNRPGITKMKAKVDVSTGKFNAFSEKFTWQPGIFVNNDFENDEWQVTPYVKSDYKVYNKLVLSTKAELFWENAKWHMNERHHFNNNHPLDWDKNGLSTFVLSADLNYSINDYVSVGPFGKLSWCLDHDYREEWKEHGNANMSSGVNTLWGIQMNINF